MSEEGYTSKAIQEFRTTVEDIFASSLVGIATHGTVTLTSHYWELGAIVGAGVTGLFYYIVRKGGEEK